MRRLLMPFAILLCVSIASGQGLVTDEQFFKEGIKGVGSCRIVKESSGPLWNYILIVKKTPVWPDDYLENMAGNKHGKDFIYGMDETDLGPTYKLNSIAAAKLLRVLVRNDYCRL